MEAGVVTPEALFDSRIQYEVPPFQRPYVWTEEDQWDPLWRDLTRVMSGHLGTSEELEPPTTHFLGAVVLKELDAKSGDPGRRWVIDGQQRLTTLQLLLDAAQHIVAAEGCVAEAESLQELVENGSARFKKTSKRFKLWPSRVDRSAFEHAMDNVLSVPADLADAKIVKAHGFFQQSILDWLELAPDSESRQAWIVELATTLQTRLHLVSIDLTDSDDDQLIFETLNDRGTPLLQADLIKNYVFQKCDTVGADVDAWADTYWLEFDEDWWRELVPQGRLFRSRIDLFLQYWLTMRLRDEVPTDKVFAYFREHSKVALQDAHEAEMFLKELRRDADSFKEFAQLDASTPIGRFYGRVVEAFELGVFIPLLLWLISENHGVPKEQVERGLRAVESWAVRRTLLRRTMKDTNNLVVATLKKLDVDDTATAGDSIATYLLDQESESRAWPTDGELLAELPTKRVYGSVKQPRLRSVLAEIELTMRSDKHELVSLPARLEIEHVMPRGWRAYWGKGVKNSAELATARDAAIHTIGNLTLVTKKLNITLSNRPWTDAAAAPLSTKGVDAGLGKRSLLKKYSLLLLREDVVEKDTWSEDDIAARGTKLTSVVAETWPRA